MRNRALALLCLLVLLGATLAEAAKVRSGYDPKFDFSKVKTWRFKVEKGPGQPDVDRRIRATVREELAKKGLRELPAGEQPVDVLVVYNVGAADGLVSGFVTQVGWYGDIMAVPGGRSVVTGAVLLEMQTPQSENAVWAAAYIMQGNTAQALMVMIERVEKAVKGALKKYPPS